MNLASRHWLSAVLLTVLALLPSSASAGMTPEEVKTFQVTKADAEKGTASAQFALGLLYDMGKGVAKDEIEAYAYWSLARTTNEDARKNLAILEKGMSPDARIRGQQRTKELQKVIEADMAAKKDALMKALYPGLKKSGK